MNKIGIILLVVFITACNSDKYFIVNGIVEGGAGETIYLEHSGLVRITTLDSVKINSQGEFRFKSPRPAYPDFYRLVFDGKQIHFAVDSTETITFATTAGGFAIDYTIEGSESNIEIQQLRKSVAAIQRKANQIVKGMKQAEQQRILQELIDMIEEHKSMARPIILKNPLSATAYFAIFQKVNDVYLFSPYDKEDRPYCAAVATSFHTYMPDYERTTHLYEIVMDAIRAERKARNIESWNEIIANAATGFVDISLEDNKGVSRKLSDLKGKVILLDFSAFESRESVQYTFALRDLYNRYAARGFEIYQVSLDRNRLLWKDAVENLPWVTVRDTNGPNTVVAATYNVTNIPTWFLINREGDIIGRNLNLQTLEREIEKGL